MQFDYDRAEYLKMPYPALRAGDAIPGYLYIFRCAKFIKVGIAGDVEKRLLNLQGANPFEVTFAKKYRFGDRQYAGIAERTAHAAMGAYRGFGEWFDIAYEDAQPLVSEVVKATHILKRIHDGMGRRAIKEYALLYDTDPEFRAKIDAEREHARAYVAKYDAKRAAVEAAEIEFDRAFAA